MFIARRYLHTWKTADKKPVLCVALMSYLQKWITNVHCCVEIVCGEKMWEHVSPIWLAFPTRQRASGNKSAEYTAKSAVQECFVVNEVLRLRKQRVGTMMVQAKSAVKWSTILKLILWIQKHRYYLSVSCLFISHISPIDSVGGYMLVSKAKPCMSKYK